MKNDREDRVLVRFSTPDPITNAIVVSRIFPDNNEEPIGKIHLDFGDDYVMYNSTNNQGEALFPPTPDFADLESKFERYSKEFAEQSLMKGFEEREESIKGLRHWKLQLKTKLINR